MLEPCCHNLDYRNCAECDRPLANPAPAEKRYTQAELNEAITVAVHDTIQNYRQGYFQEPAPGLREALTPDFVAQDAIKFFELILGECAGTDAHSWRKCRRCLAIHELESYQPLPRGLVTKAVEALRLIAYPVAATRAARPADTPTPVQPKCRQCGKTQSAHCDMDEPGLDHSPGCTLMHHEFKEAAPLPPAVAPAPSGWQPIETHDGSGEPVLVAFVEATRRKRPRKSFAAEAEYRGGLWWWPNDYDSCVDPAPTHWQPLPLPPASTASE